MRASALGPCSALCFVLDSLSLSLSQARLLWPLFVPVQMASRMLSLAQLMMRQQRHPAAATAVMMSAAGVPGMLGVSGSVNGHGWGMTSGCVNVPQSGMQQQQKRGMAMKKAAGSTQNNRDSNPKYLGVKLFGGA